ncbi:MAG TPA: flavin-dependent oxidoreductase [Acetobacteraceae bacterium]|nr:flavin-dependent oxidoreductase [Acetobacteraceae bacterium]
MKALVIGGGIGGFATALSLHERGIAVEVFEQAPAIRELGVGINLLPHAVKELTDLGLLDQLDATGIRTSELIYCNRFGQRIWTEPRGLEAGYPCPQFSIHRGQLQGLLYRAARERIGPGAIHLGHRLAGFEQDSTGVTARFAAESGAPLPSWRGDVLVGADGIHAATRAQIYPEEGPPTWNGHMLWRGAVEGEPFLSGRSMLIAGDRKEKVVLYPIAREAAERGRALINWAVWIRLGDGSAPPPRREDWSRPGRLNEVLPHFAHWRFDWFDVPGLMRRTPVFYEYPMCDRDPLLRWSFGRVTLLGDAAHPMYPVGSNGAAQAIIDGRALARALASGGAVEEALRAYEAERLPATGQIVLSNRRMGPEQVIDIVAERAPDGFERLEDVISQDELLGIARRYRQVAGFEPHTLHRQVGGTR